MTETAIRPDRRAVTMTEDEWNREGERLFGPDRLAWRFACPSCGHVAAVRDWKDAGASLNAVAFSCVGRWSLDPKTAARSAFHGKGGPCDYAGGGLIGLNPVLVVHPDGKESFLFAFAADPGGGGRETSL